MPDVTTSPFPTGGFLAGNQGDQAPIQSPAQVPQQTPLAGGGDVQSMLQGGLAGLMQPTGPPPGQMVQQRHGGLLTGLAGVMLEGLAAGMAPTAREAYEMPMRMQQQAMQQQELEMRQQQVQEEMRMQPVRDKLLLADTQMKLMQLDHAMQEMSTENQLGISDFQKQWVQKALNENRAEEMMTGSVADINKYMQEHAQDKDALQMIPWVKTRDAQGNVKTASLVKINPEAMSDPISTSFEWTKPDGTTETIPVRVGRGPTSYQNAVAIGVVHGEIAARAAEERPLKNVQEGLSRAMQEAQAAGRDPTTDPAVRQWAEALQATQKPGGGFEGQAYQQYAQAEQAAGRTPLNMTEFARRLWPQTQIAQAGLTVRQQAEARQEAAANYQVYDKSGRAVAGSMADLKAAGFPESKIVKQTSIQQQQTDASRDLIAPDGLFQIAQRQMADLQAKGKLGPIASRWNNFWARQGLDGDQQAFRNTLDMIGSRLMAAHLQRTNVSALEHFAKMVPENSTPAALKKELNEEYIYVRGQAKLIGGTPGAQ